MYNVVFIYFIVTLFDFFGSLQFARFVVLPQARGRRPADVDIKGRASKVGGLLYIVFTVCYRLL